jgi:CBS domain-containing protein
MAHDWEEPDMQVDDTTLVDTGMTRDVLTVGPGHTLRQVATLMASRKVGAAVVHDTDTTGIGIITERDILTSLGAGEDPDVETVADHQTADAVYATSSWAITQAAEAMMRGNFRHLIVIDGHEVVGMLSVRDIVRAWSTPGA